MRMFITSKNKYLSNDMKIFGTCSIHLRIRWETTDSSYFNVTNGVKRGGGGGLFFKVCFVFTWLVY